MSRKSKDAILRSDRILVGAFAIILAAASAAVGATAAYHPRNNETSAVVVAGAMQPLQGANAAAPRVAVNAASARAENASYDSKADDDSASAPMASRPVFRSATEQMVLEKLLREHRCLSEALYYEARGEGVKGEKAVAEVVFRRLRTGKYGNSICEVVYSGALRSGCQFSFTCNGVMRKAKVPGAWMQAQLLAAKIITSEERLGNTTQGATSFHATTVQPDWSFVLTPTVQIGNHIFYRHHGGERTM
jgi:spore germination cell wall hydrolase CwlJ-like protein